MHEQYLQHKYTPHLKDYTILRRAVIEWIWHNRLFLVYTTTTAKIQDFFFHFYSESQVTYSNGIFMLNPAFLIHLKCFFSYKFIKFFFSPPISMTFMEKNRFKLDILNVDLDLTLCYVAQHHSSFSLIIHSISARARK